MYNYGQIWYRNLWQFASKNEYTILNRLVNTNKSKLLLRFFTADKLQFVINKVNTNKFKDD
jgi:hypothetical protein